MNKFLKIVGAVAVINMLARFVGFVREIIIGNQYGTTATADSIINAYTIPNFIYLVIGGAFTTAFIAKFNKISVDDRKDYVRRTFTTISLTILAITLLCMLFSEAVISLYFQDITAKELELLKPLYMWMMASTVFLVLSTWLSGILNVHNKYHLSTFSVLVYNSAFLIISVVLSRFIGPIGYGVGALLGAIFMVAFLVFGVRKEEVMSFKPLFKNRADQRELWKMAIPIMIGGATAQMYIMIQRFYTNMLEDGIVTAMNIANKMSQFPQAILMTAVTTVIFPILAKKEAEGDQEAVKNVYIRGLRMLYLLILPVSLYFFFESESVIRILLERGKWNAASTFITAPLLGLFSLTMFFLAANVYVTRFYYAKGNSNIPVVFGLISVFGVNIFIINMFIEDYGGDAIAYATLISSIVNFILLVAYLQWKYKLKIIYNNVGQLLKFLLLTIAAVGLFYGVSMIFSFDSIWIHSIVTGFVSLSVYFVLLVVFKINELHVLIQKVKSKLKK